MSFDIVVAVDEEWGIGKNNGIPWPRLKADMKSFKAITSYAPDGAKNAIIMGRKTYDSMGNKPLPGRYNIIISRSYETGHEGIYLARSLDGAFDMAKDLNANSSFVIGGGEIYREALKHPQLRRSYVTHVRGKYECDIKIPELKAQIDRCVCGHPAEYMLEENGVKFSFYYYEKI